MHAEAVTDKFGGGVKADVGKTRWDLLPYDALEEVAKVYTFGANKYSDRNWEKGMSWTRLFGATVRHMGAWMLGEDRDPETGLLHTAHAVFGMLAITAFMLRKGPGEDRPCKTIEHDPVKPSIPPGASQLLKDASDENAVFKGTRYYVEDRPRYSSIPGFKSSSNADGPLAEWAEWGDFILLHLEYKWCWRRVNAVVKTMNGLDYNVNLKPGTTSNHLVSHKHVFAILKSGDYHHYHG